MTQLKTFLTRLRSYFKTGNIKALKEAFIAGSHLLMHTFKVAVVLLLILKFYKISSNSYTIKPFSVSKFLTERGFTGETVIKKIMDERQKILYYNDGSTSQSRIFFRATSKKKVVFETEIEKGKESGPLDIDGIFKTGKKLLNYDEKIISGEITQPEDSSLLTLTIYMPGGQTKKFNGKVSDIEKDKDENNLFTDVAEYITEQTTPQYLAEYLIKKSVRSNDSATLFETEQLLEKTDKLLSALEYNNTMNKLKKQEFYIQLNACRTSWYLAKAMKLSTRLRGFNIEKKDSIDWKVAYDNCYENAWKQGDFLKSSNDMAYYVLKLSVLMSVVNNLNYYYPKEVEHYKDQTLRLIQEYLKEESSLSTRIWNYKSDYFEDNQAKGFINLSIGYLSYRLDLNLAKNKTPEYYLNEAIIHLHNPNSVLSVDNNEIAAINSLVYYFKYKAQLAQQLKDTVKYKIYYENAKKALDYALQANRNDGNIYDTYAELIFDLNSKKTNDSFYEKIKAALHHSKPVDGIAVANYWKDTRWKDLVKSDVEFRRILDSFDIKDVIKIKSPKHKKNKNNAAP